MIQKPGGPKKNQKNAITYESNLQCPQCHSKLEPCLINEKDMMLNCSNKNVKLKKIKNYLFLFLVSFPFKLRKYAKLYFPSGSIQSLN